MVVLLFPSSPLISPNQTPGTGHQCCDAARKSGQYDARSGIIGQYANIRDEHSHAFSLDIPVGRRKSAIEHLHEPLKMAGFAEMPYDQTFSRHHNRGANEEKQFARTADGMYDTINQHVH
jgi:hypothetical protein